MHECWGGEMERKSERGGVREKKKMAMRSEVYTRSEVGAAEETRVGSCKRWLAP